MKSSYPTIRDVARLAGVSHQTVSRVINHNQNVSPETCKLVEEAIEQLNYRPSAIARSMARGETKTIACISPNLTDYTFASIIEGAENKARDQNYYTLSSSAADVKNFKELIKQLVGYRRIDGLIVINPYIDDRYQFVPEDFPLVFVGAHSRESHICSVSLDDKNAAYKATSHLISLGHKRIGMISGPLQEDCTRDRNEGFKQAMHESGLNIDESLIFEGDWTATLAKDITIEIAQHTHLPSAIFAQNDRMAMGVLRAAAELNWKVPEDLAVIGFDDMPLSSYFNPPLTTMRQDMVRIGREATRLLLTIIKGKKASSCNIKISAELIIRQSTDVHSN